MLDFFTPVTGTIRLIDALQNANKDFDMMLLPEDGHDLPNYAIRRSWDYFVTPFARYRAAYGISFNDRYRFVAQ